MQIASCKHTRHPMHVCLARRTLVAAVHRIISKTRAPIWTPPSRELNEIPFAMLLSYLASIYIYIYNVYVCVCVYVICICVRLCAHVCMYVCMYTIYIYICPAYVWVYVCGYIYIYIYIYIYVSIYIYIYTYTPHSDFALINERQYDWLFWTCVFSLSYNMCIYIWYNIYIYIYIYYTHNML